MSYNPRLSGLAGTVKGVSDQVANKIQESGSICQMSNMFDKSSHEKVEEGISKMTEAMNKFLENITKLLTEIDNFIRSLGENLDAAQEFLLARILKFVEDEIVSRKHAIEDAIAAEKKLVEDMKNSLKTVASALDANQCVKLAKSAKKIYEKEKSGEYKDALNATGDNYMDKMKGALKQTEASKTIDSIDSQVKQREENIVKPLPSVDELKTRVGWNNPSGNNFL